MRYEIAFHPVFKLTLTHDIANEVLFKTNKNIFFSQAICSVSGFQPVCRGTLMCRERSAGVLRKILNKTI